MGKVLGRLITLVEWWAVLLLVALTTVVCLGVFFRYVLNDPLVWYDEFASYLLVWLTFYGAVVSHYHRRQAEFWDKPYREAAQFQKAYLIHLFQDMIEQGVEFGHADTHGRYREIDTQEDLDLAQKGWAR